MRQASHDDAVSPVVGMILVLGISVVGIAAILYWGLPAIDEMKANVEHRSVESQFQELDASVKELVAGTTEKTAKRWQPTLNRGSVVVANETEGWVYATELYDSAVDYDFAWLDFGDGDNEFRLWNAGAPATVSVQAYRVNTTTSGYSLTVNTADVSAAMAPTLIPANGLTLFVRDGTGQADLENATVKFTVYVGADPVAVAFYVPTGRIDYELDAGMGTKTVTENNGAVISGNGVSYSIVNSPPLPPVADSSGVPRFFARAVVMNGTGSFAGDDRFDVLVTLYSTSTLASYDCAQSDYSDCVESTKLFIYGGYKDTWFSYLQNSGRGYDYSESTADGTTYLEDRRDYMGYTLLQSRIQLTTAGG